MIEKVKYINHMNEVIEFGANGIYINNNDLHDFAWSVTSKNDKISSFKRGITKKSLPVIIKCNSDAEGIEVKNRLFEVCEKDVIALKHGRLQIGDYYLKCYIVGHKTSAYTYHKNYAKVTLSVSTDYPLWIKETITTFNANEYFEGDNLDYDNDFPYDYTSTILNKRLNNTDFVKTNFRIRVYGNCRNPEITIGGHKYSANVTIEANEYLTIDSIDKTVFLTKNDGSTENCFNLRNKESYIFEKIPIGISEVSTSNKFVFDVTLLEERSVPKWI